MGGEAELVLQKCVLRLETHIIAVATLGLDEGVVEQSGLAHKEGFDLEHVVAVLAYLLRVDGEGPLLKGLGIGAEPEIARKGDEKGALPVAARAVQILLHTVGFALEPLYREATEPIMYGEGRHMGYDAVAGRIGFLIYQCLIVVLQIVGHAEHHLWQLLAVGCVHLGIGCRHNV